MNVYDSQRIVDVLAPHGYRTVGDPVDADLVLLNTCHIREKAAEKVYSELGRLLQLAAARRRHTGQDLRIAVAGCVAQAEGEAMQARAPFVDIIVGPQSYHRLPELLAQREREAGCVIDTSFPEESKFDHLPAGGRTGGLSAYLTVQEGCDKFCTFCVVPYTRGAEESRPAAAILAEARTLIAAGARELTLLGQNVNAYHGEGPDGRSWSLARLLAAIADIDGVWRLRYTTSHPVDMSDDLIRAHRDIPALMPFLHLPVQSGSDRVLKAMNRRGTADDYRRVVDRLRAARADLALSSDFIVGFPGETAADSEATLALVEDVGFAQAYAFKYSRRPGTPASVLPGQLPDAIKTERLERLQALLAAQQQRFNEATVGSRVEVLVDRRGRHPGQLAGRTPHHQAVHFDGPATLVGQRCTVDIVATASHSLVGHPVTTDRAALGAVA